MTKKQQDIFIAGKELFWKYGTSRVTIEEICRTAKVSKKTYYNYFKNKNELVLFILKTVTDEAWERFDDIMTRDISFEEKARLQIQMKIEGTQDLSNEFIMDVHTNGDAEVMEFLQKTTASTVQRMISYFIEAQKKGEIRANVNPGFIMYFMGHMLEMVQDDKLKSMYTTPVAMIEELINFFFYGIIDKK